MCLLFAAINNKLGKILLLKKMMILCTSASPNDNFEDDR